MRTAARTLAASPAWTCARGPDDHRRDRRHPGCCRGHRGHHGHRSRRHRGAVRSRRHRRGHHRGHRHGRHRHHHRGWEHRGVRPSCGQASSRARAARHRGADRRRTVPRHHCAVVRCRTRRGSGRRDGDYRVGASPGRRRTGCSPDVDRRHPDVPARHRDGANRSGPDRDAAHRGAASPGRRRTGCSPDGRCRRWGGDRAEHPASVRPGWVAPPPDRTRPRPRLQVLPRVLPAPPAWAVPARPRARVRVPSAPGPTGRPQPPAHWRPAWLDRVPASSAPRASSRRTEPGPWAPAAPGTPPEVGAAPAVRWSRRRTSRTLRARSASPSRSCCRVQALSRARGRGLLPQLSCLGPSRGREDRLSGACSSQGAHRVPIGF